MVAFGAPRPLPSDQDGGLLQRVLDALRASGVEHCVWKGSETVSLALSGEDDLDLLVAKGDLDRTVSLIVQQGFKKAAPRSGLPTPGVFHFYGFDGQQQRFAHMHLYSRLLTGESLVQTHWLPLEEMLLDGAHEVEGVTVATRSAELGVFVLRMMIKWGIGSRVRLVRGSVAGSIREARVAPEARERRRGIRSAARARRSVGRRSLPPVGTCPDYSWLPDR